MLAVHDANAPVARLLGDPLSLALDLATFSAGPLAGRLTTTVLAGDALMVPAVGASVLLVVLALDVALPPQPATTADNTMAPATARIRRR